MDSLSLAERVRAEFTRSGAVIGRVRPGAPVDVVPLLNWGGFVNRSFRVSCGDRHHFLKLTGDADELARLRRWRRLHHILEARYQAPALVGWIDVGGTPFAGPLFTWIDGRTPAGLSDAQRETLTTVIARLHADRDLAGMLRTASTPQTCGDVFGATYGERFVADLVAIERTRPPFVSAARLRWMRDESRLLMETVRGMPAFALPAASPTHGDLWLENVLVGADGDVHVLDWDGLALGDPLLDWCTLFGPSAADLRPVTARPEPIPVRAGPMEQERLRILARATLLDWIIDPLADWIEAASFPEHVDVVRSGKQDVHERAVLLYHRLYDHARPAVRPSGS